MGEEDQGSQRRSHRYRAAGGRPDHRLHGNAGGDARRGARRHQSGAPYASGIEPALALLGDLNGGFETPYQMQMWFEYGGGIELARDIYKRFNSYYVGPVWWGVESVPARKPLRTLADFKGVKMRVPEGLGAEIWRRAGVGVVDAARAAKCTRRSSAGSSKRPTGARSA